eukprot:COSAG01_NODE_19122_length_1029_cov_1.396774_2_plen_251_part_01
MSSGIAVLAGSTPLTTGSAQLGWMRESAPQLSVAQLQQRLDDDGYLLLRQLIAPEKVQRCASSHRAQETTRVGEDGLGHTGHEFFTSKEGLAVVDGAELRGFFGRLWGECACCTGPQVLRPVPPGVSTGFHMDNVYMARGSSRLHTVWIPLRPVPTQLGGLVVLEGSNRLPGLARMRDTYGQHDVDKTTIRRSGHISDSASELLEYAPGARWVTAGHFDPGDVVVLGMKTLHGSLRNQTESSVRLSCDIRF